MSSIFTTYRSTDDSLRLLDNLRLFTTNFIKSVYNYYESENLNEELDFKLFKLEIASILIKAAPESRDVLKSIIYDTTQYYMETNSLQKLIPYLSKENIILVFSRKDLLVSEAYTPPALDTSLLTLRKFGEVMPVTKSTYSYVMITELSLVFSVNINLNFEFEKMYLSNDGTLAIEIGDL